MESNKRYYWRRASEELYAAARAVTPAARHRRRQLVESYVRKLREICPGEAPLAPPALFGASPLVAAELKNLLESATERSLRAGADGQQEWPLPAAEA